jgi:hypothetical protein
VAQGTFSSWLWSTFSNSVTLTMSPTAIPSSAKHSSRNRIRCDACLGEAACTRNCIRFVNSSACLQCLMTLLKTKQSQLFTKTFDFTSRQCLLRFFLWSNSSFDDSQKLLFISRLQKAKIHCIYLLDGLGSLEYRSKPKKQYAQNVLFYSFLNTNVRSAMIL